MFLSFYTHTFLWQAFPDRGIHFFLTIKGLSCTNISMLFVSIKVYRNESQQGETNNWSVAFGDSSQIWGHEESNYSRFESTITRNSKRAGGHKTGTQKNGRFYFILNLAIGLNLYINRYTGRGKRSTKRRTIESQGKHEENEKRPSLQATAVRHSKTRNDVSSGQT